MAQVKQKMECEKTSQMQWAFFTAMGAKNIKPEDFNPFKDK